MKSQVWISVIALIMTVVPVRTPSVNAAHERNVLTLLNKIEQSATSAQAGMQTRNDSQIERGLGNAYVQVMSAIIQVRAQQNQTEAPGEIVDPSQQNNWPFDNSHDAIRTLLQSSPKAKAAYQKHDLQSTSENLYWILAATEYAYYQSLQNGYVDPDGDRIPGVGGFFELDGDIAYMAGVIDDRITYRVNRLLAQPNIRTIMFVNVPGSYDDNSNTIAAQKIHQAGLSTHLIDGGAIESGGVDFFLAGKMRSVSQHFNVGVHSWSGDDTSGFLLQNDRNNINHLRPFLKFYRNINIPADFYWFTISFPADQMHYMTLAELKNFSVINRNSKNPTPPQPIVRIGSVSGNECSNTIPHGEQRITRFHWMR